MSLDFRSILTVILGVALIVVGIITSARVKKYVLKDRRFFSRWGIFLICAGALLVEQPLMAQCVLLGRTCNNILESLFFWIGLTLVFVLLAIGFLAITFAGHLHLEKWGEIGVRVIGAFAILGGLLSLGVFIGWIK